MSLAGGTRLGPYEILAPLGAGGMGEVYRARDTRLGRDVAVKVIPAPLATDAAALTRFEREARSAGSISDAHIVSVYDVGRIDETAYIVTELVEGGNLRDVIDRGPVPVRRVVDLAAQLAEGLAAAHEKGIVHRDLKPENVLVTRSGQVKIADFGLARLETTDEDISQVMTAEKNQTATGTVMGTVAYMSPEQARGERVDFHSDQFSFGIIAMELLTGRHPFRRATVPETLTAILREEPASVEESGIPVPQMLSRIVSRCLEKNGDARYGSTRDLARDLRDVETSSAPVRAARADRALRPGSRAVPPVLAGIVGLAVGAALVAWLRHPTETEPIRIHALTYSGADSDPAASPDGKLVAFTSWRDGVSRIWVKQLVGGGEAPLTSGPDGLARFSPDGSSILFVRDLGTKQAAYRIGLVGGEPRPVLDGVDGADWSPDGRRIVFVRGGTPGTEHSLVGVLDLESGVERIVADEGKRILHSPRWRPDGHGIAYSVGSFSGADWRIREADPSSGRIRDLCPHSPGFQIGGLSWSGAGNALFFIQSPNLMGDVSGSGSRVVRCEPESEDRRTLFWSDGALWTTSSVSEVTLTDVLAPGRLVFSRRLRKQSLREVELGPGAPPAPRLLAEGSAIDRQPTYSPDGKSILFSSNRGGNLDLWMIDRTSGAIRQLTDDPAQDWDPAFTPDGKHVLWGSDRGTGHLEAWIANLDGSGARQVTRDGVSAQNPTMTPDGRWIVYWSGNPEKLGLWKIHPDGTGAALMKSGSGIQTEVSPDGRYVLYVDQDRPDLRNTIRVLEIETDKVVAFAIDVRYTLGGPAIIWGRARWSPDGRAIYFVGENEKGLSGIYAQDFAPGRDTAATRRPVAGFSRDFVSESFGLSPNGASLVLSTSQDSASIMVADGVPGALPPIRKARAGS